jgi:acyl-CoA dehydrogenase
MSVSSDTALLAQLATDVFERHSTPDVVTASEGTWSRELWDALEQTGLTRLGLSERNGGAGGGWPEAAAVLSVAARYAAPVPLAETTVLAGWAADEAGLEMPHGLATAARDGLTIERAGGEASIRGNAPRTPWARDASTIVAIVPDDDGVVIAVVPRDMCEVEPGHNLAREPRDTVSFDVPLGSVASARIGGQPGLGSRGALVRSIQMAGATSRVLSLTAEYVRVRKQFGRALSEFQAVQQELALLGGEAAAADAAVALAVDAVAQCDDPPSRAPMRRLAEVAVAKIRTSDAATESARLAHQLHGAIGVTYEHQLHHSTSRLWSWRDEFGDTRAWSALLGRSLARGGSRGLWDLMIGGRSAA